MKEWEVKTFFDIWKGLDKTEKEFTFYRMYADMVSIHYTINYTIRTHRDITLGESVYKAFPVSYIKNVIRVEKLRTILC